MLINSQIIILVNDSLTRLVLQIIMQLYIQTFVDLRYLTDHALIFYQ